MKKIFLSLLAILTLCTLARGANGIVNGQYPADITSSTSGYENICTEFTFTYYNPNATGEVFPIYDDCQTNVHLNIKSVMQSENQNWYETFFFEIPTVESDYLYNYVSVTGENRVWTTCNSSYNKPIFTAYPNATYLPPTGETVISVAKIDDYNVRIYVDYPDGNQDIAWNAYYPDGNATATAFHFGGECCTYSIDKITFTETNIADIELPKVDCISTDQSNFNTQISSTDAFNNWMTGDIAILNGKQTVIKLTLDNKPSWDLYTFMVTILDNAQIWRTVLGNNSVLETGTYTLTQSNSYAYYDLAGEYTISIARINSDVLRIKINTPGGETEKWDPAVSANVSATLPDSFTLDIDYSPSGGSFVAQTFHMGVDHNSYTINSITFTNIDIDGDIEVEEPTDTTIKEDTYYDNGGWVITCTGGFNETGEIAILDGMQTNVAFDITSVGSNVNETIGFEILDAKGYYGSMRGSGDYWNCCDINIAPQPSISCVAAKEGTALTTPLTTPTGAGTLTVAKIDDYNVKAIFKYSDGTTVTYTALYPNGNDVVSSFHLGGWNCTYTINSITFTESPVLSVISGNSSPTENPFVNCTKSELGTATITLGYEYKAIDEEATITVTANYDGNTEDVVGTITVADPALTEGTIVLTESEILTALFGEEYAENPTVQLRDLTLLTFEGTFGSGITLTGATPTYTPDETFAVDANTTFGGEDENEWEIRTIGVTNALKSGEISLKDAYQTTIEYTLDKVGYSGAMLVEIKDNNENSVVLYGTGFFTETERYNPTVSSSVSSGLITPSTGSATFTIAKVGNNTIEATFTYDEDTSVTFTINYPSSYDAVTSFYIGGSNCAYTVNAITFNVIENTLTIIDTENGVENQFAETVKDEEWSTVKIQLGYEYSQGTETPSIAVSANYTSNTGNSPLTGTITFGDDDPQFPSDGKEIEITQEMIFKALNIEDPNPSITLGDFTLLTLAGKNGLLLTDWHWTYTPTTNEYAKLDLIGNDATVFDGLSSTEIGTATVELTLGNTGTIERVELTVTATYGTDESTTLTGTITISDLVTASGIKTGSFTMADIKDALTTEGTPDDFDWSKVTALTLSVGNGDYKNVQLRGATVTSYTISQNKDYGDGLALSCQAFNDNLTGKIAILKDYQTNIVFEMTTVGTQDQDDTFSLTLSDMLCEGNNTISGGETAVRYPNYNIDPVVGNYTLSIANVNGTYRVYVATPESIEDFVWEGTLASDASTFTMGGTWCSYTISAITFTTIDECGTAISEMIPYATGLIDQATTFDPVINVYGSYGFNSDGSGVTFPVTEGYTTSVNVTMQPFTRVNATPAVSDNYVIETIATEEADGVTMLLGKVSTTSLDESNAVNTPTITYSPSWENLSSDEIMEMCEAYPDLTIDASIVDEKTVTFVVTWNDDTDAETPAGEYTYTLTYSEGVPEELEFQVGADGAITTLSSVVFNEIITEDENTDDDQKSDNDDQKTDDTTGGEDEGSTAIANVSVPVLEVARYNLLGQRIIAPQRGINIIVYSDGTTKKVLVK